MLSLACAVVVAAAPSLNDDDAAKRLEAAQAWVKKNARPQLTAKAARELKDCVTLTPPKETGCTEVAKLCRVHEGDDGSSGTRVESVSLSLEHHLNSLRMWWTATYEPPVTECEPPEELEGHESPEHHLAEVAAWKKTHAKEYAACLVRVKKKALADAEELQCNIAFVNTCRAEAWVSCTSKNLRKGMTALTHLHRFEF